MADSTTSELAQRSLDAILKDYPGVPSKRPERLSEEQVGRIADVLCWGGQEQWSKIPRIFAILHMINKVHAIDSFIKEGISDLWFPFSPRTLPDGLRSASDRYDFIEVQDLVLTKALDLEREDGKHRHFNRPEEIPLRKLAELGKGGFGSVDRVLSTITHREYARKVIPRGKTFRRNAEKLIEFERELNNLRKLRHEHIVRLIGSYTDQKFVCILMAPVADANLREFLTLDSLTVGHKSLLRTFYGCLATAVQYLHENQVRHKDIKPQNILVKGHQVFLTDFGISLDWSDSGQSTTTGVTVKTERYCAPEVAQHLHRNSLSDMWSLGCVFLEMWTVLKGDNLVNLNDYMASNGTRSTRYHQNQSAVTMWCNELKTRTNTASEDPPLAWIEGILHVDQDWRWPAQKLVARITDVNDDPDNHLLFLGNCCMESDDSTISEVSSKRSSRMLDETGASSIDVYEPNPRTLRPNQYQHTAVDKYPRRALIGSMGTLEAEIPESHQVYPRPNVGVDAVQQESPDNINSKDISALSRTPGAISMMPMQENRPVNVSQVEADKVLSPHSFKPMSSYEAEHVSLRRKPLRTEHTTGSPVKEIASNQERLSRSDMDSNVASDHHVPTISGSITPVPAATSSLYTHHQLPQQPNMLTGRADIENTKLEAEEFHRPEPSQGSASSELSRSPGMLAQQSARRRTSLDRLLGDDSQRLTPEVRPQIQENASNLSAASESREVPSAITYPRVIEPQSSLKGDFDDHPKSPEVKQRQRYPRGRFPVRSSGDRSPAETHAETIVENLSKSVHDLEPGSQRLSPHRRVTDQEVYTHQRVIPQDQAQSPPETNLDRVGPAYAMRDRSVLSRQDSPPQEPIYTTASAPQLTQAPQAPDGSKGGGKDDSQHEEAQLHVDPDTPDLERRLLVEKQWLSGEQEWLLLLKQPCAPGDDMIAHPSHSRPTSRLWRWQKDESDWNKWNKWYNRGHGNASLEELQRHSVEPPKDVTSRETRDSEVPFVYDHGDTSVLTKVKGFISKRKSRK